MKCVRPGTRIMGRAPNAELIAGAAMSIPLHCGRLPHNYMLCLLRLSILVEYIFWECASSLNISAIHCAHLVVIFSNFDPIARPTHPQGTASPEPGAPLG